jgi:hypothetical protein
MEVIVWIVWAMCVVTWAISARQARKASFLTGYWLGMSDALQEFRTTGVPANEIEAHDNIARSRMMAEMRAKEFMRPTLPWRRK